MLIYKKFMIGTIVIFFACTGLIAAATYVIDPYFHFHEPIEGIPYDLGNERYQNDGISRNFSYDAIVTGSSMSQNFLTSQMDELFGTESVKLPYSAVTYKECNDTLLRAISYNSEIELIIRGLDCNRIDTEYDAMWMDSYPEYLYDDDSWNDINYLLNKDVMVKGLGQTVIRWLQGEEMATFDSYSATRYSSKYGEEYAMSTYTRPEASDQLDDILTEEDMERIYQNIMCNVVSLAEENPDIQFYYFYTPYSVLYYDELSQTNQLAREFEMLEYATSLIVGQDNITLFNFLELYDVVADLDNYKDAGHYSGEINDLMIELMYEASSVLTAENYQEKMEEIKAFYMNFDYDSLFES